MRKFHQSESNWEQIHSHEALWDCEEKDIIVNLKSYFFCVKNKTEQDIKLNWQHLMAEFVVENYITHNAVCNIPPIRELQ